MAAQNEIGGRFTIDIEDLKNGIAQANRLMRLADSEFKATAAGLGNWAESAEGLTAKQKQLNTAVDLQNSKIEALQKEYRRVADAQGENSAAAQNLLIRINNETAARNKNQAALDNVSEALKEMEANAEDAGKAADDLADKEKKAADAADDAADSTESFGQRAAAVAKGGVAALVTAAAGLVTSFLASAEATREYRTEMGKLDAAFTSAGYSSSDAAAAYNELYSIIGETDQSVEAAQQIALLANSAEDVAKWAGLASGVVGKFGDALQPEAFFESANETIKLGEATGTYVQMLEGSGRSVEEFNKGLAACRTEAEKQAYMLQVTESVLGATGAAYEKNNADIIAANDAQGKLNESMANTGKLAEPVMTLLKSKAAEALDAVNNLFAGLGDVTSGKISFAEYGSQVVDKIVQSITTGAPKMAKAALQLLQNLAAGIQNNTSSLITSALTMLETITEKIRSGAPQFIKSGLQVIQNLVKGIMDALPSMISKLPVIVSNIAGVINDNAPTILKSAVNIVITIVKGIISAIPTLVKNVPKIIAAIVDVWLAFNWANLGKSAITSLGNGIKGLIGWIKGIGSSVSTNIVNAVKALPGQLMKLGKSAITDMGAAITGAKGTITKAAKNIYNAAWNGIKGLPKKMLGIGKDIVKGLWNGISNMTSWVIDKIEGFSGDILGGIKKFFKIKSPSKVMEDEVGKQLALGVAAGIEKNTKYAKASAAELGEAILDSATKRLDQYKTYNDMSLAAEKAYWDEIRRQIKSGTEARLQADKNYIAAKKSLNEQLAAAEKEYTTNVAKSYEDLKNSITSVIDAYQKEVESRADAIAGSMGLFEAFNKETDQTGRVLIHNLQSQVTALQEWVHALDDLENKGIDSDFVQYLRELGVGSAAQVDLLNEMTEKELNEYVALWQQKNSLAKEAATAELANLQQDTIDQIGALVSETETAIKGYQDVYNTALKDLGVAVKDQVVKTDAVLANTAATTILETAPTVGRDMIDGIIAGLEAQAGALYATISSIVSQAIAEAQAAAEIASPSKVMRDLIGKNLIRGAIVGIEAESGNLYTTMRNVVDNTITAARPGQVEAQAQGQQSGTVVYFTQNNTSPKALSAYEVHRQTKIAGRMILEGR